MGRPSAQQEQPNHGTSSGTLSAYTCLAWTGHGIQGKEQKLCHSGTNMELGKRITQKWKDGVAFYIYEDQKWSVRCSVTFRPRPQ